MTPPIHKSKPLILGDPDKRSECCKASASCDETDVLDPPEKHDIDLITCVKET